MKIIALLLAMASALPSAADAKARRFELALGPVHVDVPKGWTPAPDLFGVPLAILGPKREGSRPTFYVVPLGMKDTLFATSKIGESEGAFRADTERSLASAGAVPLEFKPYRKEHWKRTPEVHTFGFRYRRDNEELLEHTHFAVCGGRVYHIKSIVTVAQNEAHAKALAQLRDTFACTP